MLKSNLLASCSVMAALFLIPAISSGQTVAIVSGNGQLACPVCPSFTTQQFAPLIVSVVSSSGAPLPNTTVTWSTQSERYTGDDYKHY